MVLKQLVKRIQIAKLGMWSEQVNTLFSKTLNS